MSATPIDRETILKAVEDLPPNEQLEVAQQIMRHYLEGTRTPKSAGAAHWVGWRALAGMALPAGQTPPTDREIAEWLDERRMKEEE